MANVAFLYIGVSCRPRVALKLYINFLSNIPSAKTQSTIPGYYYRYEVDSTVSHLNLEWHVTHATSSRIEELIVRIQAFRNNGNLSITLIAENLKQSIRKMHLNKMRTIKMALETLLTLFSIENVRTPPYEPVK